MPAKAAAMRDAPRRMACGTVPFMGSGPVNVRAVADHGLTERGWGLLGDEVADAALGDGEWCDVVFLSPYEFDRTREGGELALVGLGDGLDEHVAHHSIGSPVIRRAVPLAHCFHASITKQLGLVERPSHTERHRRFGPALASRCRVTDQPGNTGQHEGADTVRVGRGEVEADATTERMTQHDRVRAELVENRGDPLGVLGRRPPCGRRRGRPKSGQIDGHRVETLEDPVEIAVGPRPPGQGQDPWSAVGAGTVYDAEQTPTGKCPQHCRAAQFADMIEGDTVAGAAVLAAPRRTFARRWGHFTADLLTPEPRASTLRISLDTTSDRAGTGTADTPPTQGRTEGQARSGWSPDGEHKRT